MSLSQGPVEIGIEPVGDRSFIYGQRFSRVYLLEYREGGDKLLFRREQDGSWTHVTEGIPVLLDGKAQTHCFDQASRLVYALEVGNEIKVTRFDIPTQQYIQNVSFVGKNPCLLMDALAMRRIANSDVVLFYQKQGEEEKIFYRRQAESYANENLLLEHTEPILLERAHEKLYRYALIAADQYGNKILDDERIMGFVSDLYPIRLFLNEIDAGIDVFIELEEVVKKYIANLPTINAAIDVLVELKSLVRKYIFNMPTIAGGLDVELLFKTILERYTMNLPTIAGSLDVDLEFKEIAVQYAPTLPTVAGSLGVSLSLTTV